MANNFEINLAPSSFRLPSSNAPSRIVIQSAALLAYDDTTTETAYSPRVRCPDTYTGSGTLKADIYYMMASATSGTLDWEVAVEAVTPGTSEDLDAGTSFDTANSNSGTVPGTAGYMQVITVDLSSKDSIAAGDLCRISLARDADDGTNDTATGDAYVHLVVIREETA